MRGSTKITAANTRQYLAFVKKNFHILRENPGVIMQLALNEVSTTDTKIGGFFF